MGAVVCSTATAAGSATCCGKAAGMSANLGDCGFNLLPLTLGLAGTLKSFCDNKAARLDGAVGKGMKNSCALGSLRVQNKKAAMSTRRLFRIQKFVFGMRLIMHEPL
jgi:hypothetical protein